MHRDGAHGVLGDVVVDLEPRVGEESRQRLLSCESVAERLGQLRLCR
jgi:hypothetical protein